MFRIVEDPVRADLMAVIPVQALTEEIRALAQDFPGETLVRVVWAVTQALEATVEGILDMRATVAQAEEEIQAQAVWAVTQALEAMVEGILDMRATVAQAEEGTLATEAIVDREVSYSTSHSYYNVCLRFGIGSSTKEKLMGKVEGMLGKKSGGGDSGGDSGNY